MAQAPACAMEFQSTPPYGGDHLLAVSFRTLIISIHAPIRGRLPKLQQTAASHYFNPRPHTGATKKYGVKVVSAMISIHAPIRGRPTKKCLRVSSVNFNPRPHTGATDVGIAYKQDTPFQSTPPYGGDLNRRPRVRIAATFQSTPPYGGDAASLYDGGWRAISIHAPIRGRR